MPTWVLWAAIASLVGYVALKKAAPTAPVAPVGPTPKQRFDQGKKDGYAAGYADGKAGKPSRVTVTREQVNATIAAPEAWMNDAAKSYAFAYNWGYLDGYEAGVKDKPATPADSGFGGGLGMMGGLAPGKEPAKAMTISPAFMMRADTTSAAPSDPLAVLPSDLRAEVDAAYASGDPQQLDDVAVKLVGAPYAAAWKKVKDDAATIREHRSIAFLDLPLGTGSVFAEIDASGEAVIPGSDRDSWGRTEEWAEIKPIADALWNRGYWTAANQLARQWAILKSKRVSYPVDSSFADRDYPVVVAGTVGASAAEFSARISPEWKNRVPHWFSHPSFRRMR